jgi:hypothetical protein
VIKMRTVELFAGTQSFSKVARELGHKTWTTDYEGYFGCNFIANILHESVQREVMRQVESADIIWMSPPCTTFSMASGNTHWTADKKPKTQEAINGKLMLDFCKKVADYCIKHHKIFFIENPRARARWFLPVEWRKTAWYCQYGDTRAKPTDIWTNLKGWDPKTCHNFRKGQSKHCHHESAPRGSKTGTQGLKGNMERSVIPPALFKEIFEVISHKN